MGRRSPSYVALEKGEAKASLALFLGVAARAAARVRKHTGPACRPARAQPVSVNTHVARAQPGLMNTLKPDTVITGPGYARTLPGHARFHEHTARARTWFAVGQRCRAAVTGLVAGRTPLVIRRAGPCAHRLKNQLWAFQ
jgi:hypothetical protein